MRSSLYILAAIATGLAAPAAAASYSAKLASPATSKIIARDIVWNCGPAACQGATNESRPVVLCQSLAKRAGRVDCLHRRRPGLVRKPRSTDATSWPRPPAIAAGRQIILSGLRA